MVTTTSNGATTTTFAPGFGAAGWYGSIAVEERFIRTLKKEGLAHEMMSLQHSGFCASLARFEDWYDLDRSARPKGTEFACRNRIFEP
jgi:hypothetical protein